MHGDILKLLWLKSTLVTKQIEASIGTIHGVGLTEYMVLQQLIAAPNNIMRRVDLAAAVGRTASGVTRLILPMEKIGLVEKVANQRDARVSLVKITPAGETIYQQASATFEQRSSQILQSFSDKQLEQMDKLLKQIGV